MKWPKMNFDLTICSCLKFALLSFISNQDLFEKAALRISIFYIIILPTCTYSTNVKPSEIASLALVRGLCLSTIYTLF